MKYIPKSMLSIANRSSRRSLSFAHRCLTMMLQTNISVTTKAPSSSCVVYPQHQRHEQEINRRTFSSYNSTPPGPLRSQPQYAIFGEKTMLSIKMIPPSLKCLKNGSIVLDQNKKGRILLEWSPRHDAGNFDKDSQIRFGLSPEEVGFMLHQLPENEVEFVRRIPSEQPGMTAADMPEKILRITPGEGGQFSFKIDYEKDNVGGQSVGASSEPLGPLEVVAQLGEYVVIRKLLEASIPSLIGWDVQTNFAMQNAMNLALQSGSGGNSGTSRSRPVGQQGPAAPAAPIDNIAADI